ncbi:MAG: AmmeMemoRadiSam system protein A [Halioglobus sp.]|nr:AmmeMemoRadiSam system protein A [Halioglobus sp.]
MAPSVCIDLGGRERSQLLSIARGAIEAGVEGQRATAPAAHGLSPSLREKLGVFVTLKSRGSLRGCIGSLESASPLAHAVAQSAHDAAFRDPRFLPVEPGELPSIRIEISVLSATEALAVASREDLLDALQPGMDGLLLEERNHRATFLPKVWEQLAEPREFLEQLLLKAGLPGDYWSATLRLSRYRTLTFADSQRCADKLRPV